MKLNIRAVEIKDKDIIYRWENTFSLWDISATRTPFSMYAIEEYVKGVQNEDIYSSKQARFMIDVSIQDRVKTVGCIDLYDLDPQNSRAGVGIFISEGNFRRKGIALKALEWLNIYSRDILNLHQLYAHIPEYNTSSLNLFLKAGYVQTTILKDWVKRNKIYYNVFVFSKF